MSYSRFKYKINLPRIKFNVIPTQDVHIWVLENLGLPGHRYRYEPCDHGLTYVFESEQDAILFSLRWE